MLLDTDDMASLDLLWSITFDPPLHFDGAQALTFTIAR